MNIHSFKHRRIANKELTLVAAGNVNAGKYADLNEVKHYNSFLCNPNYSIGSVETTRGVFSTNELVSIENNGANTSGHINRFTYDDDVFRCSIVNMANVEFTVSLDHVRVYVAPAPVVVAPPAPVNTADVREIQTTILRANTRPVKIGDNAEFTVGSRITRVRRESLVDFLVKFFTNWNETRATVYIDDNSIQTEPEKRRSLGDIFMICKYYYPTCTLKEVAKALYVQLPTTINPGFRTSYCNTIRKRVWYYDEEQANAVHDQGQNDEFGKNHAWWITQLN